MISCDKATYFSDVSQYKKLHINENLKFKAHLMACKPCSDYHEQNKMLSEKLKKVSALNSSDNSLSEDKKQEIKNKIKKNI